MSSACGHGDFTGLKESYLYDTEIYDFRLNVLYLSNPAISLHSTALMCLVTRMLHVMTLLMYCKQRTAI